jgi:release factor glutamine methyltransferase
MVPKPMRLLDLISQSVVRLGQANVDNPGLDARLLAAHALNCDRATLLAQNMRTLADHEVSAIRTLIDRRAAREPVARILGLREFRGLPFALNEATLEPRPDSETLVEAALHEAGGWGGTPANLQPPASLLDLGTGTGCLLLALLHEWPEATGLGIDIAPRAVEQAGENAARLGLDNRAAFRVGDWLEGVEGPFDVIISNPPYIASAELDGLMPEVREHDPPAALDGGADGLDPCRLIIPQLPGFLRPGGLAVFEVGYNQAAAVASLFRQAGFINIRTRRDLGGVERCVAGVFN